MPTMTTLSLSRLFSVAAGLLCLGMAACSSTKKPGYSGVVDYTTPDTKLSQQEYPFDKDGNYLEDVVSGKKKGSTNKRDKKVEPPKTYVDTYDKPPETAIASSPNYETPPASDPYAPVNSSGSTTSTPSPSKPKPSAESDKPKSRPKPEPESKPKPKSRPEPESKPKPKPKPKPEAPAKPKPKPKAQPSSITYTVQKGDTLYSLANRYGTTVSAIKSASGLSSDSLRDGKTIKIPRK